MDQPKTKFGAFLNEVGHGEFKAKVVDGKILMIPEQVILRPQKRGIHVDMIIREPLQFKLE
ncbi:MAG: hypothetical protein HZC17_00060 [Candidatus Omnitrophica bacterium]|nr:hypothetical protein [Candidatus Omnitrophota bacterium]